MISSAFKSAYTNQVAQQNQGINTIVGGVKDAAILAVGITGFAGGLGSGALAEGSKHALAGRVGGIGGNIMLSALNQKTESAKTNKALENIADKTEATYTASQVNETIQSQLGDNPINRSAIKQLRTVFETLQNAREQEIINKQGKIESSIGDIDPNSELGKKIMKGLTTPEKSFMLDDENVSYFDKNQLSSLQKRGITGDSLLDANDLAKEILDVGGEITKDGKVRVFHATTPENAKEINRTGQMFGKEDKIYFSTKRDGEIKGYGNAIVEAEIPIEKLKANDLFTDEIHLTMDTGVPGRRVNIREGSK